MKVFHHSSLPCKSKAVIKVTQEFWRNVTCKRCLKHKPKDSSVDAIAFARRNCDFNDEISQVHITALRLIADGHGPPSEIAYAAITGNPCRRT